MEIDYEKFTYKLDELKNIPQSPGVYFMKDKNTIKIFFYKAGLIYEKGYLYAINLPECSEPYKKSMALFGADIKSDNGGVWDWAEYDRADLPNYNDRNWR